MTLMLEGNRPQSSIYLLYKYNILDACLKLPMGIENLSDKNTLEIEINNTLKLVKLGTFLLENDFILENLILLKAEKNLSLDKRLELFKDFKKSIYLALLSITFRNYSKKQGKEMINGSKLIYKESLKLCNEHIKEITIFSTSVDEIISFVNNEENFQPNLSRLNNARIIRKIKNPYFLKSIFLAICIENLNFMNKIISKNSNEKIEDLKNLDNYKHRMQFDNEIIESYNMGANKDFVYDNSHTCRNEFQLINENFYNILDKYKNWIQYLKIENLLEIDSLKPIFDGMTVQKKLNMIYMHSNL